MKQFIPFVLIVSIFSIKSTIAQVVAVQNGHRNDMWLCLPNPIIVAVENHSCDEFYLTTNNGAIEMDKEKSAGHFLLRAEREGVAMIYVREAKMKTGQIIDSLAFYVRRFPLSTPRFANRSSGEIMQSIVLIQLGLVVNIECCGFDARFMVKSYFTSVLRNGKEIFHHKTEGSLLDSLTHDFFYSLKDGDVLRFENIKIQDCDGTLREARMIQFVLKECHEYEDAFIENRTIEDPMTGETITEKGKGIIKRRKN